MRKVIATASCALLVLLAAPSGAAERAQASPSTGPNYIFAGGGTNLTNGYFFPGTTFCDGSGCTGVPYAIDQGTDITFVNLDVSAVTNSHRIVSFDKRVVKKGKKGKKIKKPLFASDTVAGPGQTLMITSHVKPGTYLYYCTFHAGMYGQIEVQKV